MMSSSTTTIRRQCQQSLVRFRRQHMHDAGKIVRGLASVNGTCRIIGIGGSVVPIQESVPQSPPILLPSSMSQTISRNIGARSGPTAFMNNSLVRYYHHTALSLDDKKDKDSDFGVQTINSNLSEEEIEAILEAEEAKLLAEEEDKFVEDWKPGMRKRPLRDSIRLEDFEHYFKVQELMEKAKAEGIDVELPKVWTLRDKRCGALGIKLGMMPVFDTTWGVRYPCTVLWLDNNVVMGHKTFDKHGYAAIQVASGNRKRKNVGKSVLGQYRDIMDLDNDEEHPPYLVREFRVTDESHFIPIGSRIHARHFCPGQNIDVSSISKGKGFQGGMKRHGFGGMPATHGVSRSHRALGSTGQCQDPGKVWKGKKMAGRMGGKRVTTQNIRVLKVDRGRNLLYILGSVPGNNGHFVEIRDAVKKPLWNTPLVQDGIDRPPLPTFEYDVNIDGTGETYEEFMPLPLKDPLAPDMEEAA